MKIIKARLKADYDGNQYANCNARRQSRDIKNTVVLIPEQIPER
jgi:hypothetical protein